MGSLGLGEAFGCLVSKGVEIDLYTDPFPCLLSCTPSRMDMDKPMLGMFYSRVDHDFASLLGDYSVGINVQSAGLTKDYCCSDRPAPF